MLRRALGGSLACSLGSAMLLGAPAHAALPHVVQPGETLWSISAANNLTTRTVAVYNGLPEDAQLIAGTSITVPTVDEGAAALASGAPAVGSPPVVASPAAAPAADGDPSAAAIASAPGMGHVPSPYGELH
ncbi:MAG: LysM peptidoglycan-binding domain-containing protein [Solirubrobacterales bacterium]